MNKCYLAYFDCLGFECLLNVSNYEKRATLSRLQNLPVNRLPLPQMVLRAQVNPQRSPEIWSFWTDIDQKTLTIYSKECPQELADLIRKNGTLLYKTHQEKHLIK